MDYQYQDIIFDDALKLMEDRLILNPKIETETVELMQALHRIVSHDYEALIAQPPFDRSAVDGYAVQTSDIRQATRDKPITLTVVEEIHAGVAPTCSVIPGKAIRIMTGAPIPDGANAVIRQELTDYGDEAVIVYHAAVSYENICYHGEDFKEGERLIKEGTYLTAIEIGILASMGYAQVDVYRKPTVSLFSTGDELIHPGEPILPGKIYNSNLFLLHSRLKELGIEPAVVGNLADDTSLVADALIDAARHSEFILTTGGVSVGKKDIMHEALALAGADRIFWRVQMKPGAPTIFAILNGCLILALSGNPFGAMANLELLARPALARLTRNPSILTRRVQAIMKDAYPKNSPGKRFIRGIYQDGTVSLPKGLQTSGVLRTMQGCNCLIEIESRTAGLNPGDEVEVILL